MKMKKEEWLRGEIAKWRSEGAVDEATAATLLARYPQSESRIGWGAIIAGSFGALLVGLGVIAIFAANWDFLGRGARAAVSVAPLFVCGAVAILAKARGWRSMALWEPLGILWFVSTAAAACLVAQTYNVGGRVPDLVMFVAVLTLPVVWTTRSVAAMSAWPVLALVYGCSSAKWWSGAVTGDIAKALLMLAASIPAYVAFLRRRPSRVALVSSQLVTGLVYSFGTALMLVVCLDCGIQAGIMVFWGCSALVLAIGAAFKLPVWPMVAVVVASFAATPTVAQYRSGLFSLFVISLVFAVATTVYGIVKKRLAYMNIGSILLLYLILAKFFMSRVDFTVKGIVLIVSGVALAALNVVLVRAKRRA
jgi:uncharacterized membrane protein